MAEANIFAKFVQPEPENPFAKFGAPGNPFAKFAPRFEDQSGMERNLTTPLASGTASLRAGSEMIGLSKEQDKLLDLERLDNSREFERNARAEAERTGQQYFPGTNSTLSKYDAVLDPEMHQYAFSDNPREKDAIREILTDKAVEHSRLAADQLAKLSSLPRDEAFDKALQTGDWKQIGSSIAENPMRVWRLSLESAPQMAGAVALTPLLGAAAGSGLTSNSAEMGQALISGMMESGYNPYDSASIQAFFNDPKALANAKEIGRKRGFWVGAFDALSGGLASKMLIPQKMVKGAITREATNIAANLPIQAGLGATGEAAGQIASTGKVGAPGDVFAEAIGQLGGTPLEVIGLGLASGRYRDGKLPSPDKAAPVDNKSLEQLIKLGEDKTPVVLSKNDTPDGTTAQAPGKAPAGPPDQRPDLPEGPRFGVEDLPVATTITKENGFQGTDAALKSARNASRAFARAGEYTRQGLPEFAMKEKKLAMEHLQKAVSLGFNPPKKDEAGNTPSSIAGFPGWQVAKSNGNHAYKKIDEGWLIARYDPDRKGWTAYVGDSAFEDPPKSYKDGVFKSADAAIKKVEEVYAKVKADTAPITVTPTTSAGPSLPLAKPVQNVSTPENPLGVAKTPADTMPLIPESKLQRPFAVVQEDRSKPYSAHATREEAEAKAKELNALQDGLGPNHYVIESRRAGAMFTDETEAPNIKELVGLGLRPAQTVSRMLAQPIVDYLYQQDMPAFRKSKDSLLVLTDHPSVLQEKLAKWLKIIMKRVAPDLKLILDFRHDAPNAGPLKNGHFFGGWDNVGVIWFSPNRLMKGEWPALKTLSHEFGHAIMFSRWHGASPTTKQAIFTAFQRWIQKSTAKGRTERDLNLDFWAWPALANWIRESGTDQDKSAVEAFQTDESWTQWFEFDEFMAEQISRFFVTNKRATGIAARWFKGVAAAIKEAFKYYAKFDSKATMDPEPEITDWLLDMMLRKNGTEAPITPVGAAEGLIEGIQENREYAGQPASEIVPPQGENHYLHEQRANLGVSKKAVVQQDRYTSWLKFWPTVLQLADKNPHITGLQRYLEFCRQWMNEKMEIISRADMRVKAWRKLAKEQGRNLSTFLFELEDMTYLKKGENARWPNQAELLAIAQKVGLNIDGLNLYYDVKNDFLDILNRIEQAWIKDAQKSFKDPAALAMNIFNIKTEMNALRSKPYFPHERFGDFVVTVYGPKGGIKHSEHFDTAAQADAAADSFRKATLGNKVVVGKLSEEVKIFQGLPPTLLKQMALKVRGLTGAQLDDIEKLVFTMSPANSFSKHFSKRKGTPGYSTDGLRAYANYFLHAGGHIARLKWRDDLQASVDEVERSARAMGVAYSAKDVAKRQGIADWMKRHLEYIMNPPNEWTALRSLAFFWHLGLNASSALVNMTQIPMVAYPYLAARYGDAGAINQLRKAAVDLKKMYGLKQHLSQDERDAVNLGVQQGFLDESQNADLAGAAQHGVLSRIVAGSAIERSRMFLAHWSSAAFQAIEKMNRRVVFRAAYRLAKADFNNKYVQEIISKNQMLYKDLLGKGWMPENAAAFISGRDAVEKSQFNYSAYARPEFIRGRKGVLFAFWMFKQNMLYFYKNDPGAWRGLMILGMTAGLMGLPGADDLALMLKYASRALFGKDFDVEREAREIIIELAGEGGLSKDSSRRTADLVMLGLGRESFGLPWAGEGVGVPIPAFDVSGRLGMGSLIPGLKPALEGLGGELRPDESLGKAGLEIAGAGYGVPLGMLRAVESGDLDEFKTWERLMPTFAKNLAQAVRIAREGKETNRAGASMADVDVTDSQQLAEVVGMGLGFAPTRISRQWDVVAEQKEVISYWRIQRQMLFEEFDKARLTKDREAMADVKTALKRFNRDAPDKRLKITMQSLLQSSKQRQANRQKMEAGKPLQKTYTGVAKETKELYPSTTSPNP